MYLNLRNGKLDIWFDFARGALCSFEDAGLGFRGQFKADVTMEKLAIPVFSIQASSIRQEPRFDLGEGRYRSAIAPWEALAIGFTLLFEAF
jgi:hypothetical protein